MRIERKLTTSECKTLEDMLINRLYIRTEHVQAVLRSVNCFKVNIFEKDYDNLHVYATLPKKIGTYHILSDVIAYIKSMDDIRIASAEAFMEGNKIQDLVDVFNTSSSSPQDCFTKMGCGCGLMFDRPNPSRLYEVTDARHRLVAYGIATNMNPHHFPIPMYWGTYKSLSEITDVM